LKVTLIVQLAPGARREPQVFVSLKSPAFVPVIATLLMLNGRKPAVSVTICAALLVPTT
jgi:hypothetical protein